MGIPFSAALQVCTLLPIVRPRRPPSTTRIQQQHRGGLVAATRLCLPRVEEGAGLPRSSSGTDGRGGGAPPPPSRRRRRRCDMPV